MLTLSPDIQNIYIMGFMGCGKTTVAALLAEKLNWPFKDTDTLIEQKTRLSIPQIFAKDGEAIFRDYEKKMISELSQVLHQVIALGGGAVMDTENWEKISTTGFTITLSFSPDIIAARLKQDKTRPLLPGGRVNRLQAISDLLKKRQPCYRKADFYLHFDAILEPNAIVDKILSYLTREQMVNEKN